MNLTEMNPKKLRTLRNNLNNRLSSFKNGGGDAAPLQKSHVLAGMSEGECEKLLKEVLSEMKKRSQE
jgi:hypothetical protein